MKALLFKELREHRITFVLLILGMAAIYALNLLMWFNQDNRTTVYETLSLFAHPVMLLAGLILGQVVISKEFSGRTQFFLESLPLGRNRTFLTKWSLCLSVLVFIMLSAFAATVIIAAMTEQVPEAMPFNVLVRLLVWVLFINTALVLFSLLGRYRWFCLFLSLVAIGLIVSSTNFELFRVGPLALLNPVTFARDYDALPWDNIRQTLSLTAGCMTLALLMINSREGSIAAGLANKMSYREKIFIMGLIVFTLIFVTLWEEKKDRQPYNLAGALVSEGARVSVAMAETGLLEDDEPRVLLDQMKDELEAAAVWLNIDRFPPVFLTIRRDLDPGKYEQAYLGNREGVIVRLHYGADTFDEKDFLAWLLPRILSEALDGRGELERNRWLMDGFGLYWSYGPNADLEAEQSILMRALYAPVTLNETTLAGWYQLRERLGEELTAATAWFGLKQFHLAHGETALQQLMQRKMTPPVGEDLRATLREWRAPLPRVLEEVSGDSYASFITRWQRELSLFKRMYSEELAQLPQLDGTVRLDPTQGNAFTLSYRMETLPENTSRVRFEYGVYGFNRYEMFPQDLISEERELHQLNEWRRIPRSLQPGRRITWRLSTWSDLTRCYVGTGFRTLEVPR